MTITLCHGNTLTVVSAFFFHSCSSIKLYLLFYNRAYILNYDTFIDLKSNVKFGKAYRGTRYLLKVSRTYVWICDCCKQTYSIISLQTEYHLTIPILRQWLPDSDVGYHLIYYLNGLIAYFHIVMPKYYLFTYVFLRIFIYDWLLLLICQKFTDRGEKYIIIIKCSMKLLYDLYILHNLTDFIRNQQHFISIR